jgi:hypothetical protein
LFLDCLLKPVHLLAQLCKKVLGGVGFLSAFLGGVKIGLLHPVFLVPTTILGIVHGIHAPMLLAEVKMLLGASFLGNLAHRLGTRPLVSLLALVRSLLIGLCIGSFLVHMRSKALRDKRSKRMSTGVIPFL